MNPITGLSNLVGAVAGRSSGGPEGPATAAAEGGDVAQQTEMAQRTEAAEDTSAADDREAIQTALESAEAAFQDSALSLDFRVDDQTEQVIITVRDSNTDEVIRQIPPEERVEFARALEAAAQGETDGLSLGALTDQRA